MGFAFVAFGLLLAAVLLVRAARFRGPILTPQPPPRGILDMHCHTAGLGYGDSGVLISEKLRRSWKFPLYLKMFGVSESGLRRNGDREIFSAISKSIAESNHVSGAVILALDGPYDDRGQLDRQRCELRVPNRFVGRMVEEFDNLHFGASVHPDRDDALEELHWSKRNGAALVKWLPNIQGIDPANPGYIAYYDTLVKLDLPLLTHTGDEESFTQSRDELGDPRRLRTPLERGVRVIAAHVASSGSREGQNNIDRLLEMMPRYQNLFADISTLTQINRKRHLKTVLDDPRLEGRLLYGTDHPLTNTPLCSPWIFGLRLSLKQMWTLSRVGNPWDRDVRLKAALGVPPEVFRFSREFLGL